MKAYDVRPTRLPLPAFVLHPLTALGIALMHVYLAAGHLLKLFGGEITWTNLWKGFGASGGAYVFAALASRGLAQHNVQHFRVDSGRGSATEHVSAGENDLLVPSQTASHIAS